MVVEDAAVGLDLLVGEEVEPDEVAAVAVVEAGLEAAATDSFLDSRVA